jgi:hypothetical protein
MRSIDLHPSSTPPVSARDLVRYADRWVFVRAGKVVQHAASRDELIAMCTSRRSKNGDRFLHLPPIGPPTDGQPAAPAAPLAVPIDEAEDRPPLGQKRMQGWATSTHGEDVFANGA